MAENTLRIVMLVTFSDKSCFSRFLKLVEEKFQVRSAVQLGMNSKYQFIIMGEKEDFNQFLVTHNSNPNCWKVVEYRLHEK